MRIRRLTLFTNQIPVLTNFYASVCHFEVETAERSLKISLPESELTFEYSVEPHYYHFAFNIPENRIEDALEFVRKFARPIRDSETGEEIIDFVNWNAHAIYFTDPAGNIVEFIARHDLDNASDSGFSAHEVLSVSEIGCPVRDVQEAFDIIHTGLAVPRYSGNFETFCAAGDENGLLIITHRDRNWFPTERPSEPAPFEAWVESGNKTGMIKFENGELNLMVKD